MRCLLAVVVVTWAAHWAAGEDGATSVEVAASAAPQIGDKIGSLTFADIRFLPRSLDDLASKQDVVQKRAFVLVFTSTTCPLVQRYLPRLKELDAEFRGEGIQLVAVNVSSNDSVFDVATQAVEFDVPFPFVKDMDGSCVAACGVKRTPEVVVIDAGHRLRYRGRIDDGYRLSGTSAGPVKSELRDAIVSLLADRAIAVTETPVDGCLITRPVSARPSGRITYTDDIGPLIEQHCQGCHRPGTAAPFSLLNFDDVTAHAEMIAEVVAQQRMPPWYASSDYGQFTNARTIPAAERRLFVDWVRSGSQRGDGPDELPADMPEAETGTADSDPWAGQVWQMGEPDLILEVPFTYDVPADGYVDYKYAMLPQVFVHDTWLESVEIQPSNARVVHHANLGHLPLGKTGMYSKLITGYVPGVGPMVLDHGVAARIPAGSGLAMQIHITTTGKPETVRLRVGFRYPRATVEKELHYFQLNNVEFAIPPYASHHPVSRDTTLAEDVTLVGFFAHMHVRGKDMTFRAFSPQRDPVTLLMIPNYNFDWQLPYHVPAGQVRFSAGTRLECLAHFDNSTFNPYNPDPSATVRDGQQTFQEMMYGFVFYTKDAEQLGLEIDTQTGGAK
jgi:hypothetical protein